MGTAKKFQHQGAATLQVKEGIRIADGLNALVNDTAFSSTELPSDNNA